MDNAERNLQNALDAAKRRLQDLEKETESSLKKLQALVDITNYLAEHNFTYDEADDFIAILKDEISTSRTCNEYETVEDWCNHKPCCNIGEKIIIPLNKVDVKSIILGK